MPRNCPLPVPTDFSRQYRFTGWTLDPGQQSLQHDDNRLVRLNKSQTILLTCLCAAAFTPLSREQLSMALGREYLASDRLIDVLISQLRRHLGRQGDGSHYIRSVRNIGYMLACTVARC